MGSIIVGFGLPDLKTGKSRALIGTPSKKEL